MVLSGSGILVTSRVYTRPVGAEEMKSHEYIDLRSDGDQFGKVLRIGRRVPFHREHSFHVVSR